MSIRLLCCLALSALAVPATLAQPAATARVASPDGRLVVELATDGEGRASWRAERDGEPLIAPSRLGMMFVDAPKLERNLALVDQRRDSADATWETPWGERRVVRDRHNELRATFAERTGARRRFDVVFRVFDDGLGFRYDFPRQDGLQTLRIAEELTEFDVAPA